MDEHFNKQLTERERIGHSAKFHDVRGAKANRKIEEDDVGGKVSIHKHRRNCNKVRRKSFSENLNPLRSFIHRNVGRPWDKVFSELNKAFDRRKVVNNHIFEHLFDYVEINAKLIDGKVCVLKSTRNYRQYDASTGTYGDLPEDYYDKRWIPVKDDRCEWYVHPKDGLLKANTGKISKKARKATNEKARATALDRIFKVVDADHHLYLENGVWMLYIIKDVPAMVEMLVAPPGHASVWHALTKEQKREIGTYRLVHPDVIGCKAPTIGFNSLIGPGKGRYYATRQTASSKLLKAFDLVGTAKFNEEQQLSRRQLAKFT